MFTPLFNQVTFLFLISILIGISIPASILQTPSDKTSSSSSDLDKLRTNSTNPLVVLLWCPNPLPQKKNVVCPVLVPTASREGENETLKFRQGTFVPPSQYQPSVVAATLGGFTGGAIGGAVGGTIGSLSFVPFAGSIAGGTTAALGAGVGGAIGGGQGGAIGGALGGAVGGGVGGLLLGGAGGALGGGVLGGLGAGLGSYYISNASLPDVAGRLNTTLKTFSTIAGPALNNSWNGFLADVLLIGPEENIQTLLLELDDSDVDDLEGMDKKVPAAAAAAASSNINTSNNNNNNNAEDEDLLIIE